jgi:hypothetical protein
MKLLWHSVKLNEQSLFLCIYTQIASINCHTVSTRQIRISSLLLHNLKKVRGLSNPALLLGVKLFNFNDNKRLSLDYSEVQ